MGLFDFAISRAYYSMFYVTRAFLLGKGLSFSKHGSLIGAFGQHFAKTGIIDARFHHNLIAAFNARVKGDYEAISNLSAATARTMIQQAEEFIALADQIIDSLPPASDPPQSDPS